MLGREGVMLPRMDKFDLIVVGAGSGGLAAAQRAAEYGARVALLESGRLGGTCVNRGCVPKKIMWHAAELARELGHGGDYGFDLAVNGHDFAELVSRRERYIRRLNGIYASNLERCGVHSVSGHGAFSAPRVLSRERRGLLRRTDSDRHRRRSDRPCDSWAPNSESLPTGSSNLSAGPRAQRLWARATSPWSWRGFSGVSAPK